MSFPLKKCVWSYIGYISVFLNAGVLTWQTISGAESMPNSPRGGKRTRRASLGKIEHPLYSQWCCSDEHVKTIPTVLPS